MKWWWTWFCLLSTMLMYMQCEVTTSFRSLGCGLSLCIWSYTFLFFFCHTIFYFTLQIAKNQSKPQTTQQFWWKPPNKFAFNHANWQPHQSQLWNRVFFLVTYVSFRTLIMIPFVVSCRSPKPLEWYFLSCGPILDIHKR